MGTLVVKRKGTFSLISFLFININVQPLVTSLGTDDESFSTPIPKLEPNLPKLTTLSTHPPSPLLKFNLIEILYPNYASILIAYLDVL